MLRYIVLLVFLLVSLPAIFEAAPPGYPPRRPFGGIGRPKPVVHHHHVRPPPPPPPRPPAPAFGRRGHARPRPF
nr:unnamed protein product [Haemonchus contortus]CDJ85168.1 unnamed protein product [Haemonchus contortus]